MLRLRFRVRYYCAEMSCIRMAPFTTDMFWCAMAGIVSDKPATSHPSPPTCLSVETERQRLDLSPA